MGDSISMISSKNRNNDKNKNSKNSKKKKSRTKRLSFGTRSKSQRIEQYYYEFKILCERVLRVNMFHDVDNCVVAQSLRFNYKHQMKQWQKEQQEIKERQIKEQQE